MSLSYSAVYVLGDSLVDAGNALGLAEWYDSLPFTALPEGAPTAAAGYFDGRFSNGYTYADLIANRYVGSPTEAVFPYGYDDPWLGIPIAPFRGDPDGNSLNFAYGGAQIIRGSEFVSDLDGQTDALRDAVDGSFAPDALVAVTIGGNDVRDLVPRTGDPVGRYGAQLDLQASAARLLTELGQLVSRGLQHIVITGIPDVGLIPYYDADGDGVLDGSPGAGGGWKGFLEEFHRAKRATEYSDLLDHLIRTEVIPQIEAMGATVHYVPLTDVLDASGAVVEQGALDAVLPTIAALNDITVEAMQANWLHYSDLVFFDQVHPTAQVHALVGSYIHAQVEGTEWVETMPLADTQAIATFAGAIGAAGETDGFTIRLARGETYTVEVLGMSTLAADGSLADPTLVVLDRAGNVVTDFFAGSGDDAGLGFDATFTFTAERWGYYTLIVGGEGALTGGYVMHVGTEDGTTIVPAPVETAPLTLEQVFEPAPLAAPAEMDADRWARPGWDAVHLAPDFAY